MTKKAKYAILFSTITLFSCMIAIVLSTQGSKTMEYTYGGTMGYQVSQQEVLNRAIEENPNCISASCQQEIYDSLRSHITITENSVTIRASGKMDISGDWKPFPVYVLRLGENIYTLEEVKSILEASTHYNEDLDPTRRSPWFLLILAVLLVALYFSFKNRPTAAKRTVVEQESESEPPPPAETPTPTVAPPPDAAPPPPDATSTEITAENQPVAHRKAPPNPRPSPDLFEESMRVGNELDEMIRNFDARND